MTILDDMSVQEKADGAERAYQLGAHQLAACQGKAKQQRCHVRAVLRVSKCKITGKLSLRQYTAYHDLAGVADLASGSIKDCLACLLLILCLIVA